MTGLSAVAVPNPSVASRSPALHGGRRGAVEQLLVRRLHQLYEAERLLAFELSVLFRKSAAIPARLLLSDQRRETNQQILRLERSIQITTGTVAARTLLQRAEFLTEPLAKCVEARGTSTQSILAFPLLAAQAALAAYRSAISLAKGLGQISIVTLLATSMREKRRTVVVLAPLAEGVE